MVYLSIRWHSHFYGDSQIMAGSSVSSFLPPCSCGFTVLDVWPHSGPRDACVSSHWLLFPLANPPFPARSWLFLLLPALCSIWWYWLPLTYLWVPDHNPPLSWPWMMAMNSLMPIWPQPFSIFFSLKAVTLPIDSSMYTPPKLVTPTGVSSFLPPLTYSDPSCTFLGQSK